MFYQSGSNMVKKRFRVLDLLFSYWFLAWFTLTRSFPALPLLCTSYNQSTHHNTKLMLPTANSSQNIENRLAKFTSFHQSDLHTSIVSWTWATIIFIAHFFCDDIKMFHSMLLSVCWIIDESNLSLYSFIIRNTLLFRSIKTAGYWLLTVLKGTTHASGRMVQ